MYCGLRCVGPFRCLQTFCFRDLDMSAAAFGDELPQELAASIQRILGIEDEDEIEKLHGFDPINCLNALFPNEESLVEIDAVQRRLNEDQLTLQAEISELQEDLQHEQEPNRMQAIQEMIAVRARCRGTEAS